MQPFELPTRVSFVVRANFISRSSVFRYSCGHYGCARNRARSALTRKVWVLEGKDWRYIIKDGIIAPIDDFFASNLTAPPTAPTRNNIFGVERKKYLITAANTASESSGSKLDLATYAKLTNPNFLFRQCCEDRHLPDACLSKCHFNVCQFQTVSSNRWLSFFRLSRSKRWEVSQSTLKSLISWDLVARYVLQSRSVSNRGRCRYAGRCVV